MGRQRRRDRGRAAGTLPPRPSTRAECADAPRPCPWVSCRFNLALEVTAAGSIRLNGPHGRSLYHAAGARAVAGFTETAVAHLATLDDSCALDVAARGYVAREDPTLGDGRARTLEEVGELIGLTRERVRQIERRPRAVEETPRAVRSGPRRPSAPILPAGSGPGRGVGGQGRGPAVTLRASTSNGDRRDPKHPRKIPKIFRPPPDSRVALDRDNLFTAKRAVGGGYNPQIGRRRGAP